MSSALDALHEEIIACRACPRLVEWREEVARKKRRAYQDWEYWGKPVPGFGDPAARLLLVGLAPGAHGANRTGRSFTGDGSGVFLYGALYRAGFANQPTSEHRDDGLRLDDCFITAPLRCVPPQNRPTAEELNTCRPFMGRQLALLPNVQVILCLGGIAFEQTLRVLREQGHDMPRLKFGHGAHYVLDLANAGSGANLEQDASPGVGRVYHLLGCYHPSLQNTNTGRLTPDMMDAVLAQARGLLC